MKLKLNKIVYFLNWFRVLVQLYSNLFNTQLYSNLFKTQLYSNLFNTKMRSISKKKESNKSRHYKPFYLIISLVTEVNWVVFNSSGGTCFWLRTKITGSFALSHLVEIVHGHIHLAFLSGSFTFDTVSCPSGFCFLLLTFFF